MINTVCRKPMLELADLTDKRNRHNGFTFDGLDSNRNRIPQSIISQRSCIDTAKVPCNKTSQVHKGQLMHPLHNSLITEFYVSSKCPAEFLPEHVRLIYLLLQGNHSINPVWIFQHILDSL